MKAVFVALFLTFLLPAATYAQVVVNAETTLMIDRREPAPLQKAVDDLAIDFEKVFGQRPRIVHDPSHTGASVIWIALEQNVPQPAQRPYGWEHLRIQVVKHPGSGSTGRNVVVLTGSDLRGAIFAVYQFSQQFLGVDPLHWWTDHAPQRRTEVALPDRFSLTEGPTFHYRGWFINDEDLLTGWQPGQNDGTGISLAVWDRIFEAILRLKGNVVIPGTFIFPYEPQVRAAGERGLIVTQHHVTTVGLNTHRWPGDKPMSYVSDPGLLRSAWTRAVEQYPTATEILWTVGFRGKQDRPFWSDDPNAPSSMQGRAQVIRAAIDDQMSIIRRRQPKAKFVMYTYGEAGEFIRKGMLKVPSNVTLIQADNNRGAFRERYSDAQGGYYHTAMFDALSNHYTEVIPLQRIQQELGRMARSGAADILIVNTANVRPVLMTTKAVMELRSGPTI